jgi:hypothetical protein
MLEAALDPEVARRMREYDRRIRALLRRARTLDAEGVKRVRALFADFERRAIALLPERFAMNRAAIESVLASLTVQIAALERDFLGIVRAGMGDVVGLVEDTAEAYSAAFLSYGEAIRGFGVRPETLDLAAGFSADLIGVRSGGLGARILAEVNRTLRLSALGAGPGQFPAAVEIGRTIGAGGWSARAEAIYRTEVLRIHSLATDTLLERLNERTPTAKRWVWSRISRDEHARIDGQTVRQSERFRVPTREGGVAMLSFPRDPAGPPSAVINCGCYVVPVPGLVPEAAAA